MVVRLSKVPFGYIVKGLKPIIMILMLTVLFQLFLTRGGATLVHWWIFTITEEGLVNAVYMAIRLIYLIIGSSLMTFTKNEPSYRLSSYKVQATGEYHVR